jgi:hypothetical protein
MDTLKSYFSPVAGSSSIVTVGALDSGSISSNFGNINIGSSTITTTGAITGGSFVIGSADINENDLEAIDGVTAGTITASKVVTVDTNKDVSSFRNLTATGTITFGSLADGTITVTAFVDEDDMSSDSATLIPTQQSVKAYVDSQAGDMQFVLEDGDGTEVQITKDKEVKFVEGGGIDIDWTDVDNGTDGDPYDLTFTLTATQTGITSITNTSLVIGRDADNDIDFATDNNIIFRAEGADQVKIIDGAILPVTDNDVDLGSSSLQFKDAYFHGSLEADAITVDGTALNTVIAGVTVTNATTAAVATTVTITDNESTNEDNAIIFTSGGDVDGGNLGLESDGNLTYNPSTGTVTATGFSGNLTGTLQTAAQTNVTSLGTLTTLDVDNIKINGNTISSTNSNGDINLTPNGTGKVKASTTPMYYNHLQTQTASSSSDIEFTSTYITDDYDFYDVVITDVVPTDDDSWMGIRLGISGTVYTGADDYMYYLGHLIQRHGDDGGASTTVSTGFDAASTAIIIHKWSTSGIGSSNGESYTARIRFFNLRSATTYPQTRIMEGVSRMANDYFATIYFDMGTMRLKNGSDCRTDKIDTIQFIVYKSASDNNTIASGKFSLYGGKFHE